MFNVFKKEIKLKNGKTVIKPASKLPQIFFVVAVIIFLSFKITGFDFGILFRRIGQLTVILSKIFKPDFTYFDKVVNPLFDTIKMSLLGTIIGCLLGLPIAILSSSNINNNKIILSTSRFILSVIRSIPTLIIASITALIFGLGTFAGTVAIAIFTLGVVVKMLYEAIEVIDMGPFQAMESLGATKAQAFNAACMPQIIPTYLSYCLYCFEMNVRAAAILGWVGAGGLGILINERVGWRDYNGLGMVLLLLFITVFIIDSLSTYLRSKLS